MIFKCWSKVALACAVTLPMAFLNGVGTAQTVDSQSVGNTPPAASPRIHPQSKILPGVRLSNHENKILGVVERVVQHGDQEFALVTIGEFMKHDPGSLIAVPVKAMWIDGKEIKYDIAWNRFRVLPIYDGKKPTWMTRKKYDAD